MDCIVNQNHRAAIETCSDDGDLWLKFFFDRESEVLDASLRLVRARDARDFDL